MFKLKIGFTLCALLVISSSFSSKKTIEDDEQEFQAILLPGQNGLGGKRYNTNNVVNAPLRQYETNYENIDFGQKNCIKYFDDQLQADQSAKNKRRIFYGVSQGTATLTNWLAQKTHAEQEKEVNGLVLESVLGHGDSAIMHTASSAVPVVPYLPFSRLWIPWGVRKFGYPAYRSWGPQAIFSAAKLSPKLPVIIMHNKQDAQLSVNDARKLYCTLKENGNNNAYLMEIDGKNESHHHLDILEADQDNKAKNIAALQTMYKKHGLPHDASRLKDGDVDLKEFQPTVQEVRGRINSSTRKSWWLRNIIDCGTLAAAGCLFASKYMSN